MKTDATIPPPPEVSPAESSAVGLPARTGGGTRLIDLAGRRFGRLVVVSRAENDSRGPARWHVKCDCGKKRVVRGDSLRFGDTTSCGCFQRDQASRRRTNLTDRRFGRLIVVAHAGTNRWHAARWRVKCDCGEERVVDGGNLRSGTTVSCGCYKREIASAQCGNKNPRWNPELTQADRDRRRLGTPANLAGQVLAQQIRRRDRATCLVCGEHGTHVHHLEPWAFDRNLRYDPANLVTLCKECHTQFHELYGGDAGLEDFEEYLKP